MQVVSAVVSEIQNQDSDTTDETASEGTTDETVSGSDEAAEGTVTVVGETSSNGELGLTQVVIMALPTTMIIGISVLSAVIAFNALHNNKASVAVVAEDEADDILYSNSKEDADDEE